MENVMEEQLPTVLEVLTEALEVSNGETIDVVIEADLPGVSEDMYDWWGQNMGNTKFYKMWHPDHIAFHWEAPTKEQSAAPIANPEEKLGPYAPTVMRFRPNSPEEYPLEPHYKNFRSSTHLTWDDRELSYLCAEYEDGPKGLRIRSVFRFPAKTPQLLQDAVRQHVEEEMENLPTFLPDLYRKKIT